jgi:hypothetical protein
MQWWLYMCVSLERRDLSFIGTEGGAEHATRGDEMKGKGGEPNRKQPKFLVYVHIPVLVWQKE